MKKPSTNPSLNWPPKGVANPAQRALADAKIKGLKQLATWPEAEIAELHGMGPSALDTLKKALAAEGLSFATAK